MERYRRKQQSKVILARLILAAGFLLSAAPHTKADGETCTYENSRYEFSIDARCDYFDRFDVIVEADNGDGILLRSDAEGLEVRVYGSLVRETDQSVEGFVGGLNLHPAFKFLGTQSITAPPDRSVSVLIAPLARNYVTITVMAKSESAKLDDLWTEVANILDQMSSK